MNCAKRHTILILAAAARVVAAVPDVHFLVIGDGPDRDALLARARGLGLDDKVLFAGLHDDVYDLLRLSSLFVLSSKMEAFPNVVLEAMAAGLPVVSTDVGSVREMVEEGGSARIVPPERPDALADAIIELMLHPETMRAFGERGRSIVMERFTLDRMRSRREELFCTLLRETT